MNLLLVDDTDFLAPDRVLIKDRRLDHLRNVLAVEPGSTLRIGRLNGMLGTATLLEITEREARLEVGFDSPPPDPAAISLALALPRPKALRRLLQGVTAMGVKKIALFNAWRVEKSYWQSPLLKPTALAEQCRLGLEQARDTVLPQINLYPRFRPFVEDELPQLAAGSLSLLAHPGSAIPCPTMPSGPITLIIGPEGGFIPFEVELLTEVGCQPIHFGQRILRVETAVPAILGRLSALSS